MTTATFTLQRVLSGKTLKRWRKQHNLTAHALAIELGISRQYVKSIEGGSLEASQKVIQRFDELRARWGEGDAREPSPQTIHVVCRFELPNTIEILAKPQRCKGCKKFFIPITPNQKMHNSEQCRRTARRRKDNAKRK